MSNPREFLHELFGLEGQVAVVVGGAQAPGGALCEGLARAGATVIVAGTNHEEGEDRAFALKRLNAAAHYLAVDPASGQSVDKLVGEVLQACGHVDMLVYFADVQPPGDPSRDDATPDEKINLDAAENLCRVFAAAIAKSRSGGAVLIVADNPAATPRQALPAAASSGVEMTHLTARLARRFAGQNVRINHLSLGLLQAISHDSTSADLPAPNGPRILMERVGMPHELVGAALLLLSPRAGSYITGAALHLDGGLNASLDE